MTDRELLEAAAKAAGIDGEYRTERLCVDGDWTNVTAIFMTDGAGWWWNSLEDDGAALRLAVRLGLLFDPDASRLYSEELADGRGPEEAARRAFTRAAAALAE
jgi:hypothetical protein